jgi:ketosteroid isomerase-like protein
VAEPTATQAQNLELARRLLDAFDRGDLEAARDFIDSESEVTSNPVGINTGVYRGYDGYMTWLGQWLEAWDEFTIEVLGMQPVGERHVVVEVQQKGRGRSSGITVDQHLGQMWEIVEGNILAFHLYPSPAEAVRAAEQREADAG